jgi:uncharacterized membrane protein
MSIFTTYFQLGLEHISDVKGYDHILYLLVLCAIIPAKEWRKVLVLVTAFTIGHSLSLALSVLKIIQINAAFIELLIPVTILFTAVWNLVEVKFRDSQNTKISYLLTVLFGLVHGLGFSNFFTAIYSPEMSIVLPLFSFNLGLELGQILIVAVFLVLKFGLSFLPKFTHPDWVLFFSGIGFGLSLLMILERLTLV